MYLGLNIKHLRKSKKMSQSALGEVVGVSHSQIGAYEQESSFPTFQGLLTISRYFDVNLDDLINKDLTQEPGRPTSQPPASTEERTAMLERVNQLLEARVRELEREILRKDPEWARELGIE